MEVIYYDYVVSGFEEAFGHRRADEPCTSRDKDRFSTHSIVLSEHYLISGDNILNHV